ncbi:type IV pili methyl-accepting chemotaxis transducer N-terminal domain-containing protein [Aliarcobacter thereius]|uniref:NarX-like N-terminal domain-containing protein n=1 Tax=Aliarcobacter thereius LMG 24486 TaxID=1032240 RepID=A0A1C7WR67_9BACT|nr:type IV pili methyl-accepting chemotaxis transducer N-terminal domain-containing protein [Aliarcobacter thereius]OCL95335.1 hypothetical protein AA347_00789 [Aliarcobacter thereius LMG 24486]QBF16676.1 PilJ domain-containing protein [Aliarcobacter thereius LMG 24486]TLS93599.1 hypothetical protein FE244_03055 [Aliarcobacter thereius]
MKKRTISTKIKIIGVFFTLLMASVVATTIYLNNKSQKDATLINIAGKQRMLTQNISKNIFYLYSNRNAPLDELLNSKEEFIYNLNNLKNRKDLSNTKIDSQVLKVEYLWKNFNKNIELFINNIHTLNNDELKIIVDNIYESNPTLLNKVDELVSLYTINSEQKVSLLQNTQYLFAILILFLILYSFLELKTMEKNAINFLEESKRVMEQNLAEPLKPLEIDAEKELIEASNMFNSFINKINLAIKDSNNALIQSQNASYKLEELTNEFDEILNALRDKNELSNHLNRSEDIAIETHEQLIFSTKRVEELKKELEKIASTLEENK